MTKFADFLTEKKLDARRVVNVSASLEKLRPEDRVIRLAQRNKGEKKAEGEKKSAAAVGP